MAQQTEYDEQQVVFRAIEQGVIPPWTIGHVTLMDIGRACIDHWCGCRFTYDGGKVVRLHD